MWVSPFRNLRLNEYLPLPAAYRSLSRLSSALSAKASTLRSFQHNQFDSFHSFSGVSSIYTCIALHALALGQFFCLFSSNVL